MNDENARVTAASCSVESAGYIGSDTTCEQIRSATGHTAGLVEASAGCLGIGTG